MQEEIRTDRLILRAFEEAHAEQLFHQWNDPEVRRYLFDDAPVSRDMVVEQIALSQRRFAEGHPGFFTISLGEDAAVMIGFTGLRAYGDEGRIELLYALLPEHWGKGLATEAARAVLARGFHPRALAAIDAGADPPNEASFRVMERLGMSFVEDLTIGGRPARYYRITLEEFLRQ